MKPLLHYQCAICTTQYRRHKHHPTNCTHQHSRPHQHTTHLICEPCYTKHSIGHGTKRQDQHLTNIINGTP